MCFVSLFGISASPKEWIIYTYWHDCIQSQNGLHVQSNNWTALSAIYLWIQYLIHNTMDRLAWGPKQDPQVLRIRSQQMQYNNRFRIKWELYGDNKGLRVGTSIQRILNMRTSVCHSRIDTLRPQILFNDNYSSRIYINKTWFETSIFAHEIVQKYHGYVQYTL